MTDIQRFELKKQTASMTYQTRTENNGSERVSAATLHFAMTLPNTALDMFDAGLRPALYRKQFKNEEEADVVDQVNAQADGLNRTKFIKWQNEIAWAEVFDQCKIAIDYGIADEPPIKLGGCKVDDFKISCKDGGSIVVKFRAAVHPSEEQAGKLYTLNGREVTMHLQQPKDGGKAQQDLLDDKKSKKDDAK